MATERPRPAASLTLPPAVISMRAAAATGTPPERTSKTPPSPMERRFSAGSAVTFVPSAAWPVSTTRRAPALMRTSGTCVNWTSRPSASVPRETMRSPVVSWTRFENVWTKSPAGCQSSVTALRMPDIVQASAVPRSVSRVGFVPHEAPETTQSNRLDGCAASGSAPSV